ncbi:hypothetical protein BDZ97DRAFT_1806483 [Flammula alnicola]|nr:hypothetical protein BDZ97DRAFT_1806483 [Flammula alnicola]
MRLSCLAVLAIAPAALSAPLSRRALPTPVSGATARTYLSELVVAVDSNSPAYARTEFKTWDIISGTCDTRETVLKRDGTNVVTDSACAATSGNWVSPYDNVATTLASDLDIDHLVPLKEAFANDLTRPQLVAVTDKVYVANWLPPQSSYVCIYVRAWVTVKHYYSLTIDSAEKTALTSLLANC